MSESKITYHNKISSGYREIHVDGAHGGITPRGYISLSFFAERFPIPKSSTFLLTENSLGAKISDSEDSKKGIIRDYEMGVYMDINTAKDLKKFLEDRISELENLLNLPKI